MSKCPLRKLRQGFDDKFQVYICMRKDIQCSKGLICDEGYKVLLTITKLPDMIN